MNDVFRKYKELSMMPAAESKRFPVDFDDVHPAYPKKLEGRWQLDLEDNELEEEEDACAD